MSADTLDGSTAPRCSSQMLSLVSIRPLRYEAYSDTERLRLFVADTAVGRFVVREESGSVFAQLPGGGLEEQTSRNAALLLCRLKYEELVRSCLL